MFSADTLMSEEVETELITGPLQGTSKYWVAAFSSMDFPIGLPHQCAFTMLQELNIRSCLLR